MFIAMTDPGSTNLRSGMFVTTPPSGPGTSYLLARGRVIEPENLRYRTRKFIGSMGDANDGHRVGQQQIVECLKQGLTVGLVKPLARLVKN